MTENTNRPPLDEAAREVVRVRARRHDRRAGRAGLGRHDREDLEQELAIAVWLAQDDFDQARGGWPAFAGAVADNAARDLLRRALCGKRAPGRVTSLEDLPDEAREQATQAPGAREADALRDLAIDVRDLLARLPDGLRELALRLRAETVSQAARSLGVPRSTVAGRARRLRRYFHDAGLWRAAETGAEKSRTSS